MFFCLRKHFNCSTEKSKYIHILEGGLEVWHVVLTCYLNHIFLSSHCLVKESWPSTEPSTSSSRHIYEFLSSALISVPLLLGSSSVEQGSEWSTEVEVCIPCEYLTRGRWRRQTVLGKKIEEVWTSEQDRRMKTFMQRSKTGDRCGWFQQQRKTPPAHKFVSRAFPMLESCRQQR